MSPSNYARMHHDNLRLEDRYVREVLRRSPVPPRIVDDLWLPARNWSYLLFAGFALFTIATLALLTPYIIETLQIGSFWHSRYGIGLLLFAPLGILLYLYGLITPFYQWYVGLRYGRPAHAVIQRITQRLILRSMHGILEMRGSDGVITAKFKVFTTETNTWIEHVREGDSVYVLLHPKRDKVLLVYGP